MLIIREVSIFLVELDIVLLEVSVVALDVDMYLRRRQGCQSSLLDIESRWKTMRTDVGRPTTAPGSLETGTERGGQGRGTGRRRILCRPRVAYAAIVDRHVGSSEVVQVKPCSPGWLAAIVGSTNNRYWIRRIRVCRKNCSRSTFLSDNFYIYVPSCLGRSDQEWDGRALSQDLR